MKHAKTAFATCAPLMVSACGGSPQSSAPPQQVDALTAAAAIQSPGASPSSDSVISTAASSSTLGDETRNQTGEQAGDDTGDDARATTAAGTSERAKEPSSAPTLPSGATGHSEDGAAAFVVHYVDLVSYLGQSPEAGVMNDLAASECAACSNYKENIDYLITNDAKASGPSLEIGIPRASVVQDAAVVTVTLTQNAYTNVDPAGTEINAFEDSGTRTATVEVRWSDDAWSIQRISTAPN